MTTPDLFDDAPAAPLAAFDQAFEAWAAHAGRHEGLAQASSVASYRVLWSALAQWCVAQTPPVGPDALDEPLLHRFVTSRNGAAGPHAEPSPRHVWRVLHLVDRVLAHRGRGRRALGATPAQRLLDSRPDWRHANASSQDPLPEYLPAAQARLLVHFLSAPGAADTWQDLRNRTSVALQLGAGLTPGDVRELRTGSVVVAGGRRQGVPWKLVVPAHGASAERETPLAQWAARLLRQWLDTRAQLAIPGDRLLPSTRTGKPWGKVAHYGAVGAVLEASGIDKSLVPGGSFRLRHTFALRQLRRGRAPDEVAQWLGIVDPAVMARYRRVLFAPVDDVA